MAIFELSILRILDANLNRGIEGLRVIEEVARFVLNNSKIQKKIKEIRHNFRELGKKTFEGSGTKLGRISAVANARNSDADVGGKGISAKEAIRTNILSIIQSNCSRVAESARVFEEFAKLSSAKLPQLWKKMRFNIYSLEKQLISILTRNETKNRLRKIGLYCIIDRLYLGGRTPVKIAKEMVKGGTRIIQYRDKTSYDNDFLIACREIQKVCADSNVLFIVNDRVDIASLVNADGVHLGQEDMPVKEARRILGLDKIIGKSCETSGQVVSAIKEDIDYIAFSGIFPTETKKEQRVAGIGILKQARDISKNLPVVAIGGINEDNIEEVLRYKPDGICMISAILKSQNIQKTTANFVRAINQKLR